MSSFSSLAAELFNLFKAFANLQVVLKAAGLLGLFTWCRSCRRRWSCDSSCLLCSSRMCIRASRRPLCCRSSLASARRSASSGWAAGPSASHGPPAGAPRWPCCSFSCSYSFWRVLGTKCLTMQTLSRSLTVRRKYYLCLLLHFLFNSCLSGQKNTKAPFSVSVHFLLSCSQCRTTSCGALVRPALCTVLHSLAEYTV